MSEFDRPFDLNTDQRAMQDMILDFAAEKVAPYAVEWDEKRHLPLDVIRETATLGIRRWLASRHKLDRRPHDVETQWGQIAGKLAT
ncbi:MAG: DUF111 family protein, partial [Rhizobiaceae bacterium]|nr:DUF111 family protein [Rhizobiaceae bacterium]